MDFPLTLKTRADLQRRSRPGHVISEFMGRIDRKVTIDARISQKDYIK
jgi:hypothetical protein